MGENESMLPTDSDARKDIPLQTGCYDYFPAALAEVARLSKVGNDKHNPGEEMHHARGKSGDHADCILRHQVDRGTMDDDGFLHDIKVAWRALAQAQEALEKRGAPLARAARLPEPEPLGLGDRVYWWAKEDGNTHGFCKREWAATVVGPDTPPGHTSIRVEFDSPDITFSQLHSRANLYRLEPCHDPNEQPRLDFEKGDRVWNPTNGLGNVTFADMATVVVTFDTGAEETNPSKLEHA